VIILDVDKQLHDTSRFEVIDRNTIVLKEGAMYLTYNIFPHRRIIENAYGDVFIIVIRPKPTSTMFGIFDNTINVFSSISTVKAIREAPPTQNFSVLSSPAEILKHTDPACIEKRPEKQNDRTLAAKPVMVWPVRKVVCVLAAPPGSGKSTVLNLLSQKMPRSVIVSSDREVSRAEFETKFLNAVQKCDADVVLFDKNIPEKSGLDRVFKILVKRGLTRKVDIRFAFLVPLAIGQREVDIARKRVDQRTVTEPRALKHSRITDETGRCIFENFVAQCKSFIRTAHGYEGVLKTDLLFQENKQELVVEALWKHLENGRLMHLDKKPEPTIAPRYWGIDLDATKDSMVGQLWLWLQSTYWEKNDFRPKFHVTLAYEPSEETHRFWAQYEGRTVSVTARTLAWDDWDKSSSSGLRSVALAVELNFNLSDATPSTNNKFPHITLGVKEGTPASHSNQMLESAQSHRVSLSPPFVFSGTIKRFI